MCVSYDQMLTAKIYYYSTTKPVLCWSLCNTSIEIVMISFNYDNPPATQAFLFNWEIKSKYSTPTLPGTGKFVKKNELVSFLLVIMSGTFRK